jgi:hypothetical protein
MRYVLSRLGRTAGKRACRGSASDTSTQRLTFGIVRKAARSPQERLQASSP